MTDNEKLKEISSWEPNPIALLCKLNEHGFPTVLYRTPSSLVEECEQAFDAGLLSAALTLVVTIPDVCAKIAGTEYREWCERYLGLANDGANVEKMRRKSKTQEDVTKGFEMMERRGIFTASDLYQLWCAVVHAGSASIEGGGKYALYRVIGVCVQGDPGSIVASYGHTGTGIDDLEECAYDCSIKLEGLISLMAKGVCKFIEEDIARDRECSAKESILNRSGITVFRILN